MDDFDINKEEELSENDIVALPIDGALDLHLFAPKEIKDLVIDYLHLCREKNILEVRIIHGKGMGVLRKTVHSTLQKLDFIEEFKLAGHNRGHWGATIVYLKPPV
jgi:dsDNA-specific endonuclease/ATPase MutS2